jgi:cell division protein FtsI/penicillin-binding protein 2
MSLYSKSRSGLRPTGPGAGRWVLPTWREQERVEQATLWQAGRRQLILLIVALLVLAGLVGRIAYWQIWQHNLLAGRADQEDLRAIQIYAGRGYIFDASGHILALSVTEDEVIADPDVLRSADDLESTAATLGHALKLSESLLRGELDVPGAYVAVRDSRQQVVLLSAQQSDQIGKLIDQGDLPGIALIPVVQRVYPNGSLAA